jgi:hypothetical protein
MKVSNSLIAVAVAALLPLAAFAGDKDKTPAPLGSVASAEFNKLDTNQDSRISRNEAASDSKLVFETADKNADGYIDSNEYMHRDMSKESAPMSDTASSVNPDTDAPKPR